MKKSKFIKYNKLEQEDYEINSYIYDDCDIEDLTYFDIMNVRKNENGFFMDLGIDKMIIVYNVFYPTYYVEN